MYREQLGGTELPRVFSIQFLIACRLKKSLELTRVLFHETSVRACLPAGRCFLLSDSGRKKCIENRLEAQNSLVCSRYNFFRLPAQEITRTDEGFISRNVSSSLPAGRQVFFTER